jgi:hypothetical protein
MILGFCETNPVNLLSRPRNADSNHFLEILHRNEF